MMKYGETEKGVRRQEKKLHFACGAQTTKKILYICCEQFQVGTIFVWYNCTSAPLILLKVQNNTFKKVVFNLHVLGAFGF